MSLSSLGRNAVIANALVPVTADDTRSAAEIKLEADAKLASARKSILEALTPWIPGDFVVTYGVLLTAWTSVRASFEWMLVIAAALTVTYVLLGAFAESGFKNVDADTRKKLISRTIVGFFVSVVASIAIPESGWYDIKSFADNELSWLVTAGIGVGAVAMFLRGVQKRTGIVLAEG
jgi:L-lactate permease